MPKILIADDNKQIVSVLNEYAKKEGFETVVASDGEEALKAFEKQKFDIILLDVMMPKKDGFEVCREIRRTSNVPVIMITARGEDFERIMGLDIGADDYIVKPFSPGEVMARVRAILRRIERTPENEKVQKMFNFENLTICLDDFTVSIDEQDLPLTKKEIELLWVMATNKNRVFTRDHLLDSVWGYDYFGDNRTVDSHIKRLRAKIDEFPHPKWQIKTIWGVGYKFEVNKDE
ncbi:MAG: OmpR family two-component response regulator [Clostridiales bacterium 38_11]|nr:MAG: OmpR family two-component response regulator [Clostridiales bacterium 38_11]HBH12991.1 DNA-binding response regulator [Clostridiales bacterium]